MTHAAKSTIKTSRTARYYTLNSVQQQTENIWIVFHGYGQLAEYFIKHFENLNSKKNFIVALEGLSRFYVDGLTGRVGASWMTKEDRELEIEDQSEYINAVLADCGINPKAASQRVIVLGFSQGTATAVRWFANNAIRPDELVLWAGSFPHDVDASKIEASFKGLSTHFVHGTEDPFLKDVNLEEETAQFSKMGLNLSTWTFEGKHVMDKPTLDKIVNSFAK